jgi:hypothetical protein
MTSEQKRTPEEDACRRPRALDTSAVQRERSLRGHALTRHAGPKIWHSSTNKHVRDHTRTLHRYFKKNALLPTLIVISQRGPEAGCRAGPVFISGQARALPDSKPSDHARLQATTEPTKRPRHPSSISEAPEPFFADGVAWTLGTHQCNVAKPEGGRTRTHAPPRTVGRRAAYARSRKRSTSSFQVVFNPADK